MNFTVNKADEKRWLSMVTDYRCVVTNRSDIQRHHVVGRTYKHNKIHIGTAFVLPLWWELHDPGSNDPLNVTHYRHRFTDVYGTQRDLFKGMIIFMKADGLTIPFDNEVIDAIMDTKY